MLSAHPNLSCQLQSSCEYVPPTKRGRTRTAEGTSNRAKSGYKWHSRAAAAGPGAGLARGGPCGRAGGGAALLLCCSLIGQAWAGGSEEQEGSRGTSLSNTQN